MKRIIALIISICVLLLPLSANVFVIAEDNEIQAEIWEDFSGLKVGTKIDDRRIICAESVGEAVVVNPVGALGSVNAAKLSYPSLRGYHNIGGDQGFKLNYKERMSLKNITHIMYYFKLPFSRDDGTGNNWGKSGIAIMLYLGENIWATLKDGSEISYLSKNGMEWKTVKTQDMYTDLPTGFEGYIKVKLSDYKSAALTDSINNHFVEQSIFQFSNMGAQCGSAYLGAVYGISKDSKSIKARLNNEKNTRYLTTGLTDKDLSAERGLIESAMRAEVLQNFASYPIGYDLGKNKMFTCDHKKDVSAKLVKNIGGIFNNPSIEISSPTVGGFHDVDPYYTVRYPAYTTTDDMQAFLFYIKCAKPHPQQDGVSTCRFNLCTECNGEMRWTLLGNGIAQYLEHGGEDWVVPDTDEQGIMRLPENFEGYIMVDISEMKMNPIFKELKGRNLISSTFQFQAIGGECGNGYIDAIYSITDKVDKRNMLITFNGCDVYNLSTNMLADPTAVSSNGPTVGAEVSSIPEPTTNKNVTVSDISKDGCSVSWEKVANAVSYRLDIYYPEKVNGTTKIRYLCAQSNKVNGDNYVISGLNPSTRYHVVVNALNSHGDSVAIYRFARFTTKQESQIKMIDKNKLLKDISVTELANSDSLPIWIISGVGIVLVGGVCGFVIWLKKRKKKQKGA